MREFITLKIVCSDCGDPLEIGYSEGNSKFSDGEPTGGTVVKTQIMAKPCKRCSRKWVELESHVKALQKWSGVVNE